MPGTRPGMTVAMQHLDVADLISGQALRTRLTQAGFAGLLKVDAHRRLFQWQVGGYS
jgi:hypothetical protein